jgi:hypothetical protein
VACADGRVMRYRNLREVRHCNGGELPGQWCR